MKGCRGGKGEEGTSYLQDLVANWRLWEEYWLLPIPSPPSPLPLPSLPLHTYVLSQAPPPPYREHDVIFTRLCCELARLGRDWLLPLPLPPPPYLRLFPSPTPSIQRAWRHIYNSLLRTGAFGNSTDSPPLPPSVFFLPPPPSPSDKEHDVRNILTCTFSVDIFKWFNPFTPESDQCQITPAASPEILHHTVRRTWLFIAYSDERWF